MSNDQAPASPSGPRSVGPEQAAAVKARILSPLVRTEVSRSLSPGSRQPPVQRRFCKINAARLESGHLSLLVRARALLLVVVYPPAGGFRFRGGLTRA